MSENGIPPHFLVIVPGYMGSKLKDKTSGQVVWIDLSTIPTNPLKWKGWVDGLFAFGWVDTERRISGM